MRRAIFGAVLGESRLMRTYDTLAFSTWGWTSVVGADVLGIRECVHTFGENIVALCELQNGNDAIYHSPDSGESWTKALECAEIYDITSVGFNWTLASTSDGWYNSYSSGYSWTLIAADGEGVPVGKSVVWVMPRHLFAHDGTDIWLSENRGSTWDQVCDLTTFSGFKTSPWNSIDGYEGRVIATCGTALVETLDQGDTWQALDLPAVIRGWSLLSGNLSFWRQVVFWDTLDATDPAKSQWMISAILGNVDIIRTYVARGTGTFSPVVDMGLSQRHRIEATVTQRLGVPGYDHLLTISGDRRVNGALKQAMSVSTDGITFDDVLAGSRPASLQLASSPEMDWAYAKMTELRKGM